MLCQKQVLLFNISLNCMIVVIKKCLWCENMWVFAYFFFPKMIMLKLVVFATSKKL